jgi:hypothetical protein
MAGMATGMAGMATYLLFYGTRQRLRRNSAMYLFCCFAHGTKATGGATYISPLLTKSQNKYKYRRSSRGNSTATATYVLFTVHSNHTVAHVQYVKNVTFVTGTSQAVS